MTGVAVGRRGPYVKSIARRQQILDAGLATFASHGYRAGSIRDIADRVGMSQAGVLYHFSNKVELLAEVLHARDVQSRRYIEGRTGSDFLRGVLELVGHNSTVPGFIALHTVLAAEATSPAHPAHDYFKRRYAETAAVLTEGFAAMKRDGELAGSANPSEEARTLIALMDGLQLQWLLSGGQIDMVSHVREHLSRVTHGLAADVSPEETSASRLGLTHG